MARSHGKILTAIWRDPDFRALTVNAQWLYFVLLSQPRLTLCGSLDLSPTKWARFATDVSVGSVDQALAELEDNGYILVDSDEDELLIRTFTKYDIAPGRMNQNLAKGLWHAWRSLMSDRLRLEVIREVPDDLWERLCKHAPEEALMARELTQGEPDVGIGRSNRAFEPIIGTGRQNERFEP